MMLASRLARPPPRLAARAALSSMAELEADAWRDLGVAATYADLLAPLTAQSAAPLLAAAGMEEPARGALLDACCGAGLVLRCAHAGARAGGARGAAAGLRSVGLDFSRAMLDDARDAPELAAALDAGACALVEGDAARLPFGDASFDAVVCACGRRAPRARRARARRARR